MDQKIYLGPASTQYNELIGTAAACTPDNRDIAKLVGLDRREWTIVGYDIYRGMRRWTFDVLAVKASVLEERGIEGPGSMVDSIRQGEVDYPVTRFSLPSAADTEEVFDALFKRLSLRMIGSGVLNGNFYEDGSQFAPFGDSEADV